MQKRFAACCVFCLFFCFVTGVCDVTKVIEFGEDCEICSITDGINACLLDPSCSDEDHISCTIISSSDLSGSGNMNISLIQQTKLKSLELLIDGQIYIEEGFFIFIDDTLDSFSIKSTTTISGSTQTALTFISGNSNSTFSLTEVSFKNCVSTDGSPPALMIDTAGVIKLSKVLFRDTSSSADCGAALFKLSNTTSIVNGPYSTSMNFINTIAEGNGGGLCLFGSPGSNVTLRGPIFTGTSAQNGGGIYIRGPGSYSVNLLVDEFTTMATNGSLLFAEEFNSVTISDSLFSVAWFGTGNHVQNGAIYLVSSVESSSVIIEGVLLEGSEVKQNGGAVYLKNIDSVKIIDSVFVSCWANSGIGGAIMFDGIDSIEVTETRFLSNSAKLGSAMACVRGSLYTYISGVSFEDSISVSSNNSFIDIYSDGSCADSFWYSQTPCPNLSCNSCSENVCGRSPPSFCFCYCDTGDCVLSTPSASFVNTSDYTALSLTRYSQGEDTGRVDIGTTVAWSFFGVFVVFLIIVIIIIVVACISVYARKYYTQEYEKLEAHSWRSNSLRLSSSGLINDDSDDD